MENWSPKDKALFGLALGGVYADTQSTKELLKKGGEETNPLFPRKPSGQDLDKAAVLAALGGTGLAALLPAKYRSAALGGWAGLEHGLAYKNRTRTPGDKQESLAESGLEGPLMAATLGALVGHYLPDDLGLKVDVKKEKSGLTALLTAEKKF